MAKKNTTKKPVKSQNTKSKKVKPITLTEWITSDSNGNPKTLRRYTQK